MRIVAGDTILTLEGAWSPAPISARPPVRSSFPIAVCRSVATAAEQGTVGKSQFASVTRLEEIQIHLVMAVVTVVVPVVVAVCHHQFLVLLGKDYFLIGIQMERQGFSPLVTRVAIEA